MTDARRLLQGQFSYATSPESYLPGDFTTAYDDVIDRALDAAVRAALEGLRAEVEAEYRKPNTWYGRKYGYTDVLRFIDARLAALK